MTAHDPRVTLTEGERDYFRVNLRQNLGYPAWVIEDTMVRHVEAIIDARLAPIRALAEEWASPELLTVNGSYRAAEHSHEFADLLRAALDGPQEPRQPNDGTGGHGGSERAGEGR